jgi:hypothetical protein
MFGVEAQMELYRLWPIALAAVPIPCCIMPATKPQLVPTQTS